MNYRKLWIALGVLILLVPLGLLASGAAWGEWAPEEFADLVGYVPAKIAAGAELFGAPFSGYSIPGAKEGFLHSSLGYYVSALIGVGIIVLITYGLGRLITGEAKDENT
ncbi:fused nickel transport protein NikMN [archaeon BMS3Abin16]|nr:fused nickel transport protein NikMN [archaeon BMS3Abin16]HDY73693.1 cobalamin biosynthesis protein [Euryarchaeota archaeon]